MEDYAGRILADRYRLPLPPSDEYELVETRAFDTRSGQEVLVRQVPLPEVVDAELLDGTRGPVNGRRPSGELPAVRRAIAAAQAAASVPDHPRLDQVFDVFPEDGSLWIVSELVPARPLAALIADEPLSPYRAAEVASDVLTALRVLHAHGWTHRNITVRTVLICEDGRVVLTGLAAGAAEEALCGYDPVPEDPGGGGVAEWEAPDGGAHAEEPYAPEAEPYAPAPEPYAPAPQAEPYAPAPQAEPYAPVYAPLVAPGYDTGPRYSDHIRPDDRTQDGADREAAARAGTIAAYRAGARAAAARVEEERRAAAADLPDALPGALPEALPGGSNLPQGYSYPYGGPDTAAAPWHGATPRATGPRPGPAELPAPRPASGLPAQLALPRGYRQAEAPDTGLHPDADPDADPDTGLHPDAGPAPHPAPQAAADGWAGGPRTGLDAERARQTRMAVVGAVTERWAPEQAGPVHGHWQLAPPVGPATDLWALGALLYRAVQGHAPYPEDSVAELVEMVCAEPPAFAEECGPLRPVVESLLRQDPTERPDFEELRGWLRSLIRSAPEPDAGFGVLPMAEPDPARLPVVRRRGDLHGRHRSADTSRAPRSLGRTLLVGILAVLAAAVAYAVLFMPRSAGPGAAEPPRAATGAPTTAPPGQAPPKASAGTPSGSPESKPAPQTNAPAPPGYTTQQDPEHFEIAVPQGWERRGINEAGQVRYTDGQFTLTVVPGRDKVEGGPDPATYQKDKEPELSPYRSSTWASGGDVKTTKVGNQLRATGRYTWIDATGRSVVARNFVVALGGSYHVVLVTGPQDEEGKVTEVFDKATASYRTGG
ncbi:MULTISPECIES: serine/threonine protein kinase [unclassified Streptomyces]|uniref:serine/threonine protein kinase n=1 Tax=unclassified Streptomyces TaxID=2593676 RepID=UPI002E3388C6|nr:MULTISPECIES: serine/threonine protein kinase [unclassified Streptomyces]WUC65031.1 serine/threonine protein kinase [Streptomyces sp. NBC_00539]